MAATFDTISNAEIAVNADAEAVTLKRLVNRDDYLKCAIDATPPGQVNPAAVQTVGSGSGTGLQVGMLKRDEFTSATVVGAAATVDVDTGIVANAASQMPLVAIDEAAGTGEVTATVMIKGGSANWFVRLQRVGGASGTVNVLFVAWNQS